MKVLAKEKDLLEREKWDLRRQTKEATEHTAMLRSQLDLKENRIKELEAELAMVRGSSVGRTQLSHVFISAAEILYPCFLSNTTNVWMNSVAIPHVSNPPDE